MDIKTCKCGTDSNNFFIKKNGNQTGLYCSSCGKWQKWLAKDEIRVFEHLREEVETISNEEIKAKIIQKLKNDNVHYLTIDAVKLLLEQLK